MSAGNVYKLRTDTAR